MEQNSENYLALVTEQGLLSRELSHQELQLFQSNLWLLLGRQTARFTLGDSSSVPVETAQELLKSICFCIGLYLKTKVDTIGAVSEIKEKDLPKLYQLGLAEVERHINKGKELLEQAVASTVFINNTSYYDTLTELSSFFKKYDYRFMAHQIPCMIDYQLYKAVPPELEGIEYINKYLQHLIIENTFCSKFDSDKIISLLTAYCEDYKGLLINIFEPVAVNALGLALLGKNALGLDISETDRGLLVHSFLNCTEEQKRLMLNQAVEKLSCSLILYDGSVKEYLLCLAEEMLIRVDNLLPDNDLRNIFLTFKTEESKESAALFVDGIAMEDEALRHLINEISNCRHITDKITIVKRSIHSLRDLVEVLDICFWEEELTELFNAMEDSELAVLYNFVLNNSDTERSSINNWESRFIQYIQTMVASRRAYIQGFSSTDQA